MMVLISHSKMGHQTGFKSKRDSVMALPIDSKMVHQTGSRRVFTIGFKMDHQIALRRTGSKDLAMVHKTGSMMDHHHVIDFKTVTEEGLKTFLMVHQRDSMRDQEKDFPLRETGQCLIDFKRKIVIPKFHLETCSAEKIAVIG